MCGKTMLPPPVNLELLPNPQKRPTIWIWVQLLWAFGHGHFEPQCRFLVPNNCAILVCFHPLTSTMWLRCPRLGNHGTHQSHIRVVRISLNIIAIIVPAYWSDVCGHMTAFVQLSESALFILFAIRGMLLRIFRESLRVCYSPWIPIPFPFPQNSLGRGGVNHSSHDSPRQNGFFYLEWQRKNRAKQKLRRRHPMCTGSL